MLDEKKDKGEPFYADSAYAGEPQEKIIAEKISFEKNKGFLEVVLYKLYYIAIEKEKMDNIFVGGMLDQLPPRQRNAIVLYYIEEKK